MSIIAIVRKHDSTGAKYISSNDYDIIGGHEKDVKIDYLTGDLYFDCKTVILGSLRNLEEIKKNNPKIDFSNIFTK